MLLQSLASDLCGEDIQHTFLSCGMVWSQEGASIARKRVYGKPFIIMGFCLMV